MAKIKTQPTPTDPHDFIAAVDDPKRRADAEAIVAMLERVTGHPPAMWGPSIIGFGSYDYRYDSGHSGTMCRLGFSPRKANQVLYVLTGAAGEEDRLARLGKHRIGKSCLYINRLADIDPAVLEQIATDAWDEMNRRYPPAGPA
ncbi:DUF1801 domain-containing protein [Sphingomonas sp. 1P06PA]|uniref:DUF1801 domain-containing protein n=1 Tax=Sphingomonas sp. 1P06PA TaxID=554121 RepID=UPI0039A58A70